jgi:hypothetical protein
MAAFSSFMKFMCFRGIDDEPSSTKEKKPRSKPAAAPAAPKAKPPVAATPKQAGGARRTVDSSHNVSTAAVCSVMMAPVTVAVCCA